jgi:predicted permease
MNPFVAASMWLYRRLAYAFPHEFQIVYGTDLIRLGDDAVEEIWKRNGFFGLLRLVADIAVRVPVEYLSEMRRDLQYALRALIKSPGFAAVGIISLGLGIGVTTTAFSELNATLLRDLPGAQDPKRLVMTQASVSYPYYEHYRDQHDLFTGATAYIQAVPFAVALEGTINAKTERVFGHLVSPDYFLVLGVSAARGRVLGSDADKPGDAPVVVISDRFWRNRLNSDPHAVGRTLRLNGQTATIVGITPKEFLGVLPMIPADLFVPVTAQAQVAPELGGNVLHSQELKVFSILMRLAPGVSKESAEAALDTITRYLDEDKTFDADRNRKGRRVRLFPGGGMFPIPPEIRPVVLGFWGTLMGLILTIACMNLANMLLARAAGRRREVAIRLAVGASRFRLIRQMLTETVLLAVCGGLAGLAFAFWLTNLASNMKLPFNVPIELNIRPDWHVLLFTLLISVAAGLGFGLAPALDATKADVAPALKGSAAPVLRRYRRFGLRNLLMVYQVAGSLMLLLITGFLVIGFSGTAKIDVGFDANSLYLLSLDPVRDGYSPDQAATFFEKLPERLRRVGAVQEVALAEEPPFANMAGKSNFSALSGEQNSQMVSTAVVESVGAGYFAAISVPVLRGREFTEHDQRMTPSKGQELPAVVSETATHELFGNADPVGRRIENATQTYEVVGMVRIKTGFAGVTPNAHVFTPITRKEFVRPPGGGFTLMVRADAGTDALAGIRREIAAIDPNLSVFNVRTLREHIDQLNAMVQAGVIIYGGIGLFGLVLASIGLAGVTAYSVAQRRKEIGIRMALGARRIQVLLLVLREGSALVLTGSVLGLAGAFGVSKALSAMTHIYVDAFKVGTNDPRLIFGAPLLLAGLAMLACYLPARRSTKIDPLLALREE